MERFEKILVDFIKGRATAEQGQQELAELITAHPELTQNCVQQLNKLYSSRHLLPQHYSMFRDALTRPLEYCTPSPTKQTDDESPSDSAAGEWPGSSDPIEESSAQSDARDEELDPLAAFDNASDEGSPETPPTSGLTPEKSSFRQSALAV